tara:strand:+ start:2142 stop:2414 length:273 start_codon:yes stop_codon:yes gene_type:complete
MSIADNILEITAFIKAARAAGVGLNEVESYGSGALGYSADEAGEDPFFEYVALSFEDEDGKEHELSLLDTTTYNARRAMYTVDSLLRERT